MLALGLVLLGACGDDSPTDSQDTGCEAGEVGPLSFSPCAPRNLLMLSLDTVRRDHLGWFSGGEMTPGLDDWLGEAVVLEDHMSCSNWTFHALSCALGGQSAVDVGWLPRGESDLREPVPDESTWLAEHLAQNDFESALISTNPILSERWNTDAGYDYSLYLDKVHAEEVVTNGLEHLGRLRTGHDRWFLHLHFMDTHTPYAPPEAWLEGLVDLAPIAWDLGTEQGYIDLSDAWAGLDADTQALAEAHIAVRYQGALRYLDDTLATLMADETVQAALEDTLVVLWTDHGEQFYDHGASGHGHHLFTEENAALAAFAGSGLAPQRWTAPTSLLDLQPTILAALGLAPATVASGWQLGERDPDAPRYLLASTRQGPVQAIKTPSETLHYEWSGERSFYDRAADPAETLDLYDSQDDRVIALWELLEAEMLRVEALIPDQTPVSPGP